MRHISFPIGNVTYATSLQNPLYALKTSLLMNMGFTLISGWVWCAKLGLNVRAASLLFICLAFSMIICQIQILGFAPIALRVQVPLFNSVQVKHFPSVSLIYLEMGRRARKPGSSHKGDKLNNWNEDKMKSAIATYHRLVIFKHQVKQFSNISVLFLFLTYFRKTFYLDIVCSNKTFSHAKSHLLP